MLIPSKYLEFLKDNGTPMSSINPGSDEYALSPPDALKAICLLEKSHVAICGGDVLEEKSGKLEYSYENWYCDQKNGENPLDYVVRSRKESTEFINKLAAQKNPYAYVVLVHSELGVV